LIIITGLPTSGKTTRANQLHAYLTEKIARTSPTKYRLHLISDTSLAISRTVYDLSPAKLPAHSRSANASEKDARAALYAAVKRVLTDRDIVILDSPNYIKGWRYQLYCEAKAVRTPSVILQIGCSVDEAREANEARLKRKAQSDDARLVETENPGKDTENATLPSEESKQEKGDAGEEPYAPENWENLVFRYEEPNAMNRWDSPLFTLIRSEGAPETEATFDALWDAIAGETRKPVRPNQATVQRSADPGADYLYVLDRETQEIVRRILEHQQNDGDGSGGGGEIRIPGDGNAPGEDLLVHLPGRNVGLPQLQRMRRAFVGLHRGGIGLDGGGNVAAQRIRSSFVGYLNDAFEKDG
jgi:protein KTI12